MCGASGEAGPASGHRIAIDNELAMLPIFEAGSSDMNVQPISSNLFAVAISSPTKNYRCPMIRLIRLYAMLGRTTGSGCNLKT
jgi:hypothetical protein